MVEEGLLSAEELAHALQAQAESGKPLGETLVALGYASPGAVANALAEQHGGLLRTEFGVSTGLSSADDRPALHAAPPVAPLSPAPGTEHEHDGGEPGSPLGAGLRLAGAPAPAAAPLAESASPPAAAAAPAQLSSEEKAVEIAKFASLHTDLDAVRAELEQKSTHLTEVTARLDETLSQLRASQSARDAFAAKAAELEAKGQLAAEPDPAVAARVQELEAQLQAAAADRDALQQKLLEADAPAAPDPALTARVQELEAHIEDMKNVVAAAEAHAEAETASIRTLESELQTVGAGRDALAEQVAALQTKLNETLEATATATPDPVVTARVEELEQQLQTTAAGRDALAEQVAALQTKLNETLEAPVAAPDPVMHRPRRRARTAAAGCCRRSGRAAAEAARGRGACRGRCAADHPRPGARVTPSGRDPRAGGPHPEPHRAADEAQRHRSGTRSRGGACKRRRRRARDRGRVPAEGG